MPRDGSTTRDQLIRAAERLFARDGVDGVLTRDLVAEAGQANDSAVSYHFGSRAGLLRAVLDKHLLRMEEQYKRTLEQFSADTELVTVLEATVKPLAEELRSEDGRDFLRITAQLAGKSGVRTGEPPKILAGTALAGQLELLRRACRRLHSRAVTLERIALFITMLTAALADRANRIEHESRMLLGHEAFVANLLAMLHAALRASPEQS